MEIRRNAAVSTAEEMIGRVSHVIVDPETREATHIAVESGRGERLVPIGAVQSAVGDHVLLRGDGAMFDAAPAFDRGAFSAVDGTAPDARRPLLGATGDAVVLGDGAPTPTGAPAAAGAPAATASEGGPYHLQLREEHLRAETRPEQAGSVLVHRRITEHVETIEVPVREERLVLERRPGSGPVTVEGRVLQEGETFEIVLMREQIVVRREPIAYEAVDIRREVVERVEHVEGTVRRERLSVDDPTGAASLPGGLVDGREGPLPNAGAPAPIGYRPGQHAAPRTDAPAFDAQPTEPLERARATDMYDPEPTPAVYASVVPGRAHTPVMEEPLTDATNPQTTGSPADIRDQQPYEQRLGGQTRTSPSADGATELGGRATPLPDMQPGMSAANRAATAVPADRKPASSGEYNPGGGEYAEQIPPGPGGTEVATGDGSTGHGGTHRHSNYPPNPGADVGRP